MVSERERAPLDDVACSSSCLETRRGESAMTWSERLPKKTTERVASAECVFAITTSFSGLLRTRPLMSFRITCETV
jgi:hypothetical protein